MQSSFTVGLLAGAMSGAVCGSLAVFLLDTGDVGADASVGESAQLRIELERLREDHSDLVQRFSQLEQQPLLSASSDRETAPVALEVEQELFEERVRDALARIDRDHSPRPALLPEVEQAVRVLEEEKEREQQAAREQAIAERIEERLERAAKELTLAPDQINDLRTSMTDYSLKSTEMFTNARESGDFGSVREEVRALRKEAEESLTAIMTPTQYEQYRESELNLLGFGGPDRGRGGGGGGDRGGRDRGGR